MPNIDILTKYKNIHMIGIGGVSMSGIAAILKNFGFHVTGSDANDTDSIKLLKDKGIKVTVGHNLEDISKADVVVYSAAIKQDDPEMLEAKKLNIETIERADFLGILTRCFKDTICISGTHGKTTTTSMLTQLLTMADYDPTAIIGGKLPFLGSNSRIGKSDIIVCEACEYVDTFLHLNPAISIILNIDEDHLDYFGTLDRIIESFHKFAQQTTSLLIVNGDDANTLKAIKGIECRAITFGFGEKNDYRAVITNEGVMDEFDIIKGNIKLTTVKLKVPGKHNVMNALAAAVACFELGVSARDIANGLGEFTGAHRRFEILGTEGGITVADDFAHHPTELRATLTAAMEMGYKNVWAVFQPHTYSRTAMLLDDFADALSIPDHTVLSEILAVRETNTYNIYSKDLADKIKGCVWFETFEEITDFVVNSVKPGDLIITLGGGNVYMCANMIYDRLKQKYAE